jgi:hypothetical protein
MMGALEEGKEAYYRGDDLGMNPYDESDDQYDEWRDGWWMA